MKGNTRLAALAVLPSLLSLLYVPQAGADPSDVNAGSVEADYRSPFQDYINDEDAEMIDWVEANERVGDIGGWRTYLKQARESKEIPESQDAPSQTMPSGGHGAEHTAH